ncbi:MAG TPA: argininosuccinate synthase [Candidatus Polarisedimenticolaceae bacterium]|nr:argininosuccinate synthase [Candidatus Polarisedimenticolaceae bacterium]
MQNIVALAFSGGLDTSYCVARLREDGFVVHTVYVDTGGVDESERDEIAKRSEALGAEAHHAIDARDAVFRRFVRVLIRGNVLRGEVYPLSVAAERTQQAISVVERAREIGAASLAHGSTGAGNDQVRFDVAFRVLAPEMRVVTPVRDVSLTREAATRYLVERGLPVPAPSAAYSINRGLWGATYGGGWTHDAWEGPPEDWLSAPPDAPGPEDAIIGWTRGVPVSLDGEALWEPELVRRLAERCAAHGIGRGIHIGETALGIKGRIGFEAGAALVLVAAHRELEKLVLTRWQAFWKDHLGRFYGDRLHEGHWFDPALRDIETLIDSSQRAVDGETRVRLDTGRFLVTGARSPHSLFAPEIAVYGEEPHLWSGEEARAFARISAVPDLLAARRS